MRNYYDVKIDLLINILVYVFFTCNPTLYEQVVKSDEDSCYPRIF